MRVIIYFCGLFLPFNKISSQFIQVIGIYKYNFNFRFSKKNVISGTGN